MQGYTRQRRMAAPEDVIVRVTSQRQMTAQDSGRASAGTIAQSITGSTPLRDLRDR